MRPFDAEVAEKILNVIYYIQMNCTHSKLLVLVVFFAELVWAEKHTLYT